jgi:hypothetical protein
MSKSPEHEALRSFEMSANTVPTSSSVKRITCSGRFDHKFRALFTLRRKKFSYVEKALGMGISFRRGPDGEPGSGLMYEGLWEIDERGSRNGVLLSEEAQCRKPLGRDPLQGTLEDMLRKAPDKDISPHRGLYVRGGPRIRRGCVRIPGTCWRRNRRCNMGWSCFSAGLLSWRTSHKLNTNFPF